MLETDSLTIRFGGHAAVDGVSCAFTPGTLTSIVGPNGAGKTTYFNLISGQLPATSGRVRLNGEDITGYAAPRRTRLGLGRAFQLTQLFPNLAVRENVRLAIQAREAGRGRGGGFGGLDLCQRFQPGDGAVEHLHDHHAEADRPEQLRGGHLPVMTSE